MTSESLHVRATFLPNKGDEANGFATVTVEIVHRISMVIPEPSAIPAAMSSLRLSGAEIGHVLEALEASHACTVDSVTTLDDVIAAGFQPSE